MVNSPCWCEPSNREKGRLAKGRRRLRRGGLSGEGWKMVWREADGGGNFGKRRRCPARRLGWGKEYLGGRRRCGREKMKREEVGGRFEGGQMQMTSSGKRRLVSARNQVPRKINCVKQYWLTCDKFFTGPTITMVPRLKADWNNSRHHSGFQGRK